MFIIQWAFDKLGYMPKIDMQVGKLDFEPKIPDLKMPAVKKATTRTTKKPAVVAKTARAKKAK
jgi:hypothetical protein